MRTISYVAHWLEWYRLFHVCEIGWFGAPEEAGELLFDAVLGSSLQFPVVEGFAGYLLFLTTCILVVLICSVSGVRRIDIVYRNEGPGAVALGRCTSNRKCQHLSVLPQWLYMGK